MSSEICKTNNNSVRTHTVCMYINSGLEFRLGLFLFFFPANRVADNKIDALVCKLKIPWKHVIFSAHISLLFHCGLSYLREFMTYASRIAFWVVRIIRQRDIPILIMFYKLSKTYLNTSYPFEKLF